MSLAAADAVTNHSINQPINPQRGGGRADTAPLSPQAVKAAARLHPGPGISPGCVLCALIALLVCLQLYSGLFLYYVCCRRHWATCSLSIITPVVVSHRLVTVAGGASLAGLDDFNKAKQKPQHNKTADGSRPGHSPMTSTTVTWGPGFVKRLCCVCFDLAITTWPSCSAPLLFQSSGHRGGGVWLA
jgi:hypothetical protein